MKRIIIICEGPTEQEFCKTILYRHFQAKEIYIQTPLIKKSKGGIVKWKTLKNEIETHLKYDSSAFVTTFIDYYGINSKFEFPDWQTAEKITEPYQRMATLEKAMINDLNEKLHHRFIPYLQLHEFEGLLFTDIDVFYNQVPTDSIIGKEELEAVFAEFSNPELINDGRDSSPSHRLKRIIKGYNKIVYAGILAEAIGLNQIRNKSPRFNSWIEKLEKV